MQKLCLIIMLYIVLTDQMSNSWYVIFSVEMYQSYSLQMQL